MGHEISTIVLQGVVFEQINYQSSTSAGGNGMILPSLARVGSHKDFIPNALFTY